MRHRPSLARRSTRPRRRRMQRSRPSCCVPGLAKPALLPVENSHHLVLPSSASCRCLKVGGTTRAGTVDTGQHRRIPHSATYVAFVLCCLFQGGFPAVRSCLRFAYLCTVVSVTLTFDETAARRTRYTIPNGQRQTRGLLALVHPGSSSQLSNESAQSPSPDNRRGSSTRTFPDAHSPQTHDTDSEIKHENPAPSQVTVSLSVLHLCHIGVLTPTEIASHAPRRNTQKPRTWPFFASSTCTASEIWTNQDLQPHKEFGGHRLSQSHQR